MNEYLYRILFAGLLFSALLGLISFMLWQFGDKIFLLPMVIFGLLHGICFVILAVSDNPLVNKEG